MWKNIIGDNGTILASFCERTVADFIGPYGKHALKIIIPKEGMAGIGRATLSFCVTLTIAYRKIILRKKAEPKQGAVLKIGVRLVKFCEWWPQVVQAYKPIPFPLPLPY